MVAALRRAGFRKGVVGGNRAFLVIWMVLGGVRLLKRLSGRGDKVVYCEELAPGERLIITHEPGT